MAVEVAGAATVAGAVEVVPAGAVAAAGAVVPAGVVVVAGAPSLGPQPCSMVPPTTRLTSPNKTVALLLKVIV